MSGTRRFATDEQRQSLQSYWRRPVDRVASPVQRIVIGLGVFCAILSIAIVGYVLSGWSWLDSLYMVVITVSGVGYGEVRQVDTPVLRWLTMALIVFGYMAAIYTFGGFAQLLIDGELRRILGVRRMHREIERLRNHVVICGFGRMGTKLAESLASRGKPLIVIDQDESRVETARSFGCLALHGNATEESVLKAAGVEYASILTTVLSDDVANLFITITAHDLNPKLEILARAENTSTIKKLRQVGASKVVLPATIGADRLANMILRPSAESLLEQAELPEGLNEDLSSIGLRLDELEIQPNSSLVGGSLADFRAHCGNRFLVVALRSNSGVVSVNPDKSIALGAGDCVIILAHDAEIAQLCSQFSLHSELERETNDVENVEAM
ncbi:MAG: potassium channel protein [Pirellulaceae bacterium]